MKEDKKPLPQGQLREHDTFFGEKLPANGCEAPPPFWPYWASCLSCLLMIGPFFLTVASVFTTGLPLAGILVAPGAVMGLANWISPTSPAARTMWRGFCIGCLASCFLLAVLASQW